MKRFGFFYVQPNHPDRYYAINEPIEVDHPIMDRYEELFGSTQRPLDDSIQCREIA